MVFVPLSVAQQVHTHTVAVAGGCGERQDMHPEGEGERERGDSKWSSQRDKPEGTERQRRKGRSQRDILGKVREKKSKRPEAWESGHLGWSSDSLPDLPRGLGRTLPPSGPLRLHHWGLEWKSSQCLSQNPQWQRGRQRPPVRYTYLGVSPSPPTSHHRLALPRARASVSLDVLGGPAADRQASHPHHASGGAHYTGLVGQRAEGSCMLHPKAVQSPVEGSVTPLGGSRWKGL